VLHPRFFDLIAVDACAGVDDAGDAVCEAIAEMSLAGGEPARAKAKAVAEPFISAVLAASMACAMCSHAFAASFVNGLVLFCRRGTRACVDSSSRVLQSA